MNVRVSLMAMLLPALAACAPPQQTSSVHAQAGDAMTATRLYFGMRIRGGGSVSDAQWRGFLAQEVTPRFPDGLTVLQGRGQWREPGTGKILRERTRVLLLLHKNSDKAHAAIAAIIARYKTRFRQRSVLRIDAPVRVTF